MSVLVFTAHSDAAKWPNKCIEAGFYNRVVLRQGLIVIIMKRNDGQCCNIVLTKVIADRSTSSQ